MARRRHQTPKPAKTQNWLTRKRRSEFNQTMKVFRDDMDRGKSTPNPLTEFGWEQVFGDQVHGIHGAHGHGHGHAAHHGARALGSLYKKVDLVFACLRLIYTSTAEAPLVMVKNDEEEEQITEDPLLEILQHPNPFHSWNDIVSLLLLNLNLTGAAYLWEIKTDFGELEQLWAIPTAWVKEVWKAGELIRYEIKDRNKTEKQIVAPMDMTAIKMPDPNNPLGFAGPLQATTTNVDTDIGRASYMLEMLTNAKVASVVLSQEEAWTDEQMTRADAKLEDKIGLGQRGGSIFLSGKNAKADFLAPLKDIDWKSLSNLDESRVCSVFGVPPILVNLRVGLESGTYSNFKQAKELFVQSTMVAIWTMLGEALTRGLLRNEGVFDRKLVYDTKDVEQLQINQNERTERVVKEWDAGLITRNEARVQRGNDTLPDEVGEVLKVPLQSLEVRINDGMMATRRPPIETPTFPPDDGTELDDEGNPIEDGAANNGKRAGGAAASRIPQKAPAAKGGNGSVDN